MLYLLSRGAYRDGDHLVLYFKLLILDLKQER
jgi:hypothetical protein